MYSEQDFKQHVLEVAEEACEFFGLPMPEVKVSHFRRGFAYRDKNLITIPFWASKHTNEFITAYVAHEVTHLYRFSVGPRFEASHGPEFHAAERRVLAHFGIVPVYARAYIKALQNAAGQTIFEVPWKKQTRANRSRRQKAVEAVITPADLVAAFKPRKKTPLEIILED